MLETFVVLLAAHLVADFVFQTDWIIRHKHKAWGMAIHILAVALTATLAIGNLALLPLAAITLSHLAMDLIKVHLLKDTWRDFLIDQAVHVSVIAGVAVLLPSTFQAGVWGALPAADQNAYLSSLVVVCGIILAVPAGGFLIGKLMDPLDAHKPADEGLPNGGLYIGWLERGLTLLFVLMGQPEGVGLLLAAKSILRFSDVNTTQIRKHTEYVILGTLLSFAWALLTAVLTQLGLRHWH